MSSRTCFFASSSPSSAFSAETWMTGISSPGTFVIAAERRLPVVDVTDGADVDVRLCALELLLCHCSSGSPFLCLCSDELRGDPLRDVLVALELHRERGPTLRHRTQVGGVTEHLGQRNHCLDRLCVAAGLEVLHPAAA